MQFDSIKRRSFLKSSAALVGLTGAAQLLPAPAVQAEEHTPEHGSHSPIKENEVILFQGDSITDAGRGRQEAGEPNNQKALGNGYAWLAGSQLLVDHPGHGLKVFNRGISGHKVFQLAERWQKDCLDIRPNVLSILIGVNDIWHKLNGSYDGTVEVYEHDYRALLNRTKEALPGIRLVICEPFVLRCGAVNEKWFPSFDGYRAAAKKIAQEFHAAFVPFQSMFDDAVKFAPPQHWAGDGVHPSKEGASLMAHNWLKAVYHAHG